MNKAFLVALSMLLVSCASSHNLANGRSPFGGGYKVVKVSQNKYKITAITNWAPWPNYDDVREMWDKHAKSACGNNEYRGEIIGERVRDDLGTGTHFVTVKEGYATCINTLSH